MLRLWATSFVFSRLFSCVWRHTEGKQAEQVEPDTRNDDVEDVVEDASTDVQRNGDVGVSSGTNGVDDRVSLDAGRQQPPLAVCHVVRHVHHVATRYDVHLITMHTTTARARSSVEE